MKTTTILFLIKKEQDTISEICLAMKKRGFGVGRWNGTGGKLQEGESVEQAAIRETEEEINVQVKKLYKVAELEFSFVNKSEWNQWTHVFFCEDWEGLPSESDEMKPEWFLIKDIPFSNMWPDDIFWLPEVLNKKHVKGKFLFGEGDTMLEKQIEIVESF